MAVVLEWEYLDTTANVYVVSFWSHKNVLKLILMIVSQVREHTKKHLMFTQKIVAKLAITEILTLYGYRVNRPDHTFTISCCQHLELEDA